MAYNGSGTFNRLYTWEDDRDADILIRADRMDAEMDGFATGLTTALTKDGQTNPSANLPMNSFKHTGVANATARTHYAAYGQVQDSTALWAGTAGGTANALTLTMTPTVTAYAAGQSFTFVASATSTSTVTVNVDSVGAKNIYHPDGVALGAGSIVTGHMYTITYDGTQFALRSARGTTGALETSGSATVTLTSASARVQSITMTAAEKYVVLPDATTLAEGRDFLIRNAASAYWFGLQDNGGTLLASVPPGVTASVTLIDNASAAGVWAVHGSAPSVYGTGGTPKVLWPFYSGTATTFEGAEIQACAVAALSATKAIAVYSDTGDSGHGKAVIIDVSGVTATIGTPATFESADTCTSENAHKMAVCALSATQALVVYIDTGNSSYGTACILDVSGSTITPGTPAVFEAADSDSLSVCTLSSTKAIVVYGDNGNSGFPTACVLDVSGSTITPATAAALDNEAVVYSAVVPVSATQALACYTQTAQTYFCVLDVSGSTITPATPVSTTMGDDLFVSLVGLSSTLFVAAGDEVDLVVATLSGSTITVNAITSVPVAQQNYISNTFLFLHKVSASRFAHFFLTASDATSFPQQDLRGPILDTGLSADGSTYHTLPRVDGSQGYAGAPLVPSGGAFWWGTMAGCALSTSKVLFVGTDYNTSSGLVLVTEIVT